MFVSFNPGHKSRAWPIIRVTSLGGITAPLFHRFFQEMRLRCGGQYKLRPGQRHSIPISPKASAILVTNTAVGDGQDGAASWRELQRLYTHKTRQWGRVPPFLQLQQLYLHPGLIPPPPGSKKEAPGTQTQTVHQIICWCRGEKATFPRRNSPSVGKFPEQHRSRISRPLQRQGGRDRVVQPPRWMERQRLDGWTRRAAQIRAQLRSPLKRHIVDLPLGTRTASA